MNPRDGTPRARQLRTASTDAELLLWKYLRARNLSGAKFRRQFPIGGYIADFVCLEAKLIVEADGSQHTDNAAHDALRTMTLRELGYRVMRFWNNDVLQSTEAVLIEIASALAGPPSPQPSPASGTGGKNAPLSASPASGTGGKSVQPSDPHANERGRKSTQASASPAGGRGRAAGAGEGGS